MWEFAGSRFHPLCLLYYSCHLVYSDTLSRTLWSTLFLAKRNSSSVFRLYICHLWLFCSGAAFFKKQYPDLVEYCHFVCLSVLTIWGLLSQHVLCRARGVAVTLPHFYGSRPVLSMLLIISKSQSSIHLVKTVSFSLWPEITSLQFKPGLQLKKGIPMAVQ